MQGRVFLERYETIRLLGEGGMGQVFLARQTDLNREVVVKVMHDHIAADPVFRERFARETMVMARFQHPYAVTLYDARLDDVEGESCIVMEYIRGVTLESIMQNGERMPPARVGRLLRMLCEVLQAAHVAGIIHRDLKPANVMIVDPGTPYEMLKVMDFGLAKLLAPGGGAVPLSNAEFAVGTPGYMCPEQARGEEMDHRGDLYSVGIMLYEMLTGRLPFADRGTMEILIAHATEEPPCFSAVGARGVVSSAVEEVVQWCLAKSPFDRPPDARNLAEAFEMALGPSGTTPAPEPSRQEPPFASRREPARRPPPLPPGRGAAAALADSESEMEQMSESESEMVPVQPHFTAPSPAPAQPAGPSAMPPVDPRAIVNHLEAWMPEKIATYKLRGFIHDVGGELIESVPGRIKVKLGGKGCVYTLPGRGALSWLGLGGSHEIDMELHLKRADQRDNLLRITVMLRPGQGDLSANLGWRRLCNQIFCDLRGYLMGSNSGLAVKA
jgi:serine/threonine-protein kinase